MAVTDDFYTNSDINSMPIPDEKYVTNNKEMTACMKDTFNHINNDDEDVNDKKSFSNNRQTSKIVGNTDELKSDDIVYENDSKKRKYGDVEDEKLIIEHTPPDGGIRAWMIMVGSFTINGILFSVINSYSLIFLELVKKLEEIGETEVNAKAALVGSLTIGTTFFLSPIAGILTDKIGIQITTFIGGALAFGGMLLSSIFSHKVEILYLTYGVMYGLGASLAYTPSLVILGHYFKRRLGLVNGIVTAGSSVFTIIMPYMMGALLKHFGLDGTLRSLAILTSLVMMCAVLFKPLPVHDKSARTLSYDSSRGDNFIEKLKTVINISIWKKKRYVVWASAIPIALFGYFVPYVHIGNFVVNVFGPDADKKLPVMCIGITSGIGRLVFGYIADLPRVNRILLQQISFVSIGILTMLLPLTPPYYLSLLIITLFMGLFDGCFISLLGPIAFDICGRNGATQAIGCLLGMCSIPLTIGPPIAGLIFEHSGSYTIPFILAGVPPIIGATAMFLVRCIKDEKSSENSHECADESINADDCLNGITRARLDIVSRERQEGRSECEITRSAALCNASLQNSVCYFHPYSYDHRNDFNCRLYSESVPLLFSRNNNGDKSLLFTN